MRVLNVSAVFGFMWLGLQANAQAQESLNFSCQGGDGTTSVHYVSLDYAGKPELKIYQEKEKLRNIISGDQMQTSTTVLGELISFEVGSVAADAPATRYTLIAPKIEWGSSVSAKDVKAILIISKTGGFVAPPLAIERFKSTVELTCEVRRAAS